MDENGDRKYRRVVPDGFLAEMPVWVRAAAVVGIPGAIAFFLVWIGGNTIPRMQQELSLLQQQHALLAQAEQQREQRAEDLFRLMQRICANTAHDSQERQRCFDR